MAREPVADGALRAMIDHAGGVGPLATELHVSRAALHRWSKGGKPVPAVQALANGWARRRGLDEPFPEEP